MAEEDHGRGGVHPRRTMAEEECQNIFQYETT
jgi:hypothetical protein